MVAMFLFISLEVAASDLKQGELYYSHVMSVLKQVNINK